MGKLKRDHLPKELEALLKGTGINGTVAIQARQSVAETEWLLGLADKNDFIKAVVGWVNLRNECVEADLERFSSNNKLKGVRHVLHDEADDRFMLRDDFLRGVSKLHKFSLTYDILIFPRHLNYATELVKKFPNQLFVIDHIAKPSIKTGEIQPWQKDMQALAKADNVYCKFSGMVTEASWHDWKPDDFRPYLEAVLEIFGPERLMFGSDWPVCTLAADYQQVLAIVSSFINQLSPNEQSRIMGLNAASFYNLTAEEKL